jgi:hypothetical protein
MKEEKNVEGQSDDVARIGMSRFLLSHKERRAFSTGIKTRTFANVLTAASSRLGMLTQNVI